MRFASRAKEVGFLVALAEIDDGEMRRAMAKTLRERMQRLAPKTEGQSP